MIHSLSPTEARELIAEGEADVVVFAADVEHSYVNPGSEECVMYLVMTYAH